METKIFLLSPHLAHIPSAAIADGSWTVSGLVVDVVVDQTGDADRLPGRHTLE